jgi:hypothetical protein
MLMAGLEKTKGRRKAPFLLTMPRPDEMRDEKRRRCLATQHGRHRGFAYRTLNTRSPYLEATRSRSRQAIG